MLEKEWLCGPCIRAKQTVVEGAQNLITAEDLTIDEVCLCHSVGQIQANTSRNAHTSKRSHKTN